MEGRSGANTQSIKLGGGQWGSGEKRSRCRRLWGPGRGLWAGSRCARSKPSRGRDLDSVSSSIARRISVQPSPLRDLCPPPSAPVSFSSRKGFASRLRSLGSQHAPLAAQCGAWRCPCALLRRWAADPRGANLLAAPTVRRTLRSPALPRARLPNTVGSDGLGLPLGTAQCPLRVGGLDNHQTDRWHTSGFHVSAEARGPGQ